MLTDNIQSMSTSSDTDDNIQSIPTCSDARLISNDANSSSIHPSKADDYVFSVVCLYLVEISFVYNLQQQIPGI